MMAVLWTIILSGCGKFYPFAGETDARLAKVVSFQLESAVELLDFYRADLQTCWNIDEKDTSIEAFSRQLSTQPEKLQETLDILIPGKQPTMQQAYLQESAENRLLALRLTFHLSGTASQVESHLLAAKAALSEMESSKISCALRDMYTACKDYFSYCENPGDSSEGFSEKTKEITQTIQRCRVKSYQ